MTFKNIYIFHIYLIILVHKIVCNFKHNELQYNCCIILSQLSLYNQFITQKCDDLLEY